MWEKYRKIKRKGIYMAIDKSFSINKVDEVLKGTSSFKIESTEEFNKGIDHIIRLIKDSMILYKDKSYASSYYLSVIVIEEIAKIHMGLYVRYEDKVKRDKLYDHKTKDIIGCNYTITLGTRLKNAIGQQAIEKIINQAYSGNLKDNRENAFYCSRINNKYVVPSDLYSQEDARNMLLFAIESFDDNLVGYTEYSFKCSKATDLIFDEIISGE